MTGKPAYAELEERIRRLEAELLRRGPGDEMPREGDQKYRRLFNEISEGVYLHDLEGRILDVNPMACSQSGYSRRELLALNVFDLFPQGQKSVNMPKEEVLRQWRQWPPGHHISLDVEHRCKDGRVIPVKISAGSVSWGDSRLILAVVQDITDRKEAERERHLSQQETRRLAEEQATLAEIGRVISSTPDIETIYQQFASLARKLVPFDSLSVNLVDLSDGTFRFAYNFGRDLFDERVGRQFPLAGSMTGQAVRRQRTMRFNAPSAEAITGLFPDLTMVLSFQAGFLSNMLVPLFAKNVVIGVLHFRTRAQNTYGVAEAALAERIGTQIAGAIANALLFEDLRRAEENYRTLFREMLNGLALHEIIFDAAGNPVDYRILAVNPAFEGMTGLRADDIVGQSADEVRPVAEPCWPEIYGKVARTGKAASFESYSRELDKHFEVTAFRPAPNQLACLLADITDRKQNEAEREAAIRLLGILNSRESLRDCMKEICQFLRDWLAMEALGIRLRDGEDFPYFETRGFPDDFVAAESPLCTPDIDGQPQRDALGHPVLACMCGNILTGRFDPALPFFTAKGSFWTNSTTALLAATTEADRQSRTRNRCNGEGYESVALIPLRLGESTFGLIQINDKRRGRLTPRLIAQMERMADTIAISLAHRKTQLELQVKEQELSRITETSPIGITQLDADGKIVFANRQAEAVLGLQKDEILRHSYNAPAWKITDFSGNPLPAERLPFRRVKETRRPVYDARHAVEWPDGRRRCLSINAAPLFSEGGQFDGVVAAISDITERLEAEEQLRQSEANARAIMDASTSAIVLLDRQGTILDNNDAHAARLGLTRSELVGRCVFDLFPADVAARRRSAVEQVFQTGEPLSGQDERDGRWNDYVIHPVRDAKGVVTQVATYAQEITDQKRAEEEKRRLQDQLLQAQKMESVGRLAGGVAHDFNNMLGVIFGHVEMALEQLDPAQPLYRDLQAIGKAAERSANLTRQLLAFARKQVVAPQVLDLNETVEGMLKMLRRLIGENIDLAWLPGGGLSEIRMDPSQIDQVLANLCINARDAIADVGRITIETRDVTVPAGAGANHPGLVPGQFVLLAVSDDGCGMDQETRSHLFEPFFTTKGVGKGTGLGLATVYGIVEQNNGFIDVTSEPGEGTTFGIYLPRYVGPVQQRGPEGAAEPARRGHETVLVVEDEPDLLSLTTFMLEKLGYRVLGACSPGEAVRLASERAGEIALLFTDVVMPEMNGRELARQVLAFNHRIKCLFMSGYTADVIAPRGVLDEGTAFIPKPFSRRELAAKVREVLDRP